MAPPSEHTRTPREALHALVLALFTAEEFRRWLRLGPDADVVPELPGESAADAAVIDKALGALERRGGIDAAFFARMATERERRRDAITVVAALWGAPERAPADSLRSAAHGASPEPGAGLTFAPTVMDVERPAQATDEVSATPTARSRPSRRVMLQAGGGALLAGLVAVSLYMVLSGSDGDGKNGGVEDGSTISAGQPNEMKKTELPEVPTPAPMKCDEDTKFEGTACVPRCPAGTRFIPGTGEYVFIANKERRNIDAFCLDITEVTVAAFRAKATPESYEKSKRGEYSQFDKYCNARRKDREDHPMNCVDWEQASAHCVSIGGRLPTEWEWEWAARGRDEGRKYPWGSEAPDCNRAIFSQGSVSGCEEDRTWAVGSLKGEHSDSRDGLHDMSGNVWEWTDSMYSGDRVRRVLRGGCWDNSAVSSLLASRRQQGSPSERSFGTGFRCARTIL